jgi:hypothetical protein
LFFDPEDPADIARCVIEFLGSADLPPRLRQAAVSRAAGFTWHRAAELAEESFRRCYRDAR